MACFPVYCQYRKDNCPDNRVFTGLEGWKLCVVGGYKISFEEVFLCAQLLLLLCCRFSCRRSVGLEEATLTVLHVHRMDMEVLATILTMITDPDTIIVTYGFHWRLLVGSWA